MDPKFQQLRAFYYAYRMRSLTKAGEQLHLSQSAMSRLIKQLEEVLGQRLFDRTSGALCTTEAAEEAIHVVERILTNVEYLKTSLKGLADKRRGMVGFASTAAPGRYGFPPTLPPPPLPAVQLSLTPVLAFTAQMPLAPPTLNTLAAEPAMSTTPNTGRLFTAPRVS
mgnify:CR=1 FL=1